MFNNTYEETWVNVAHAIKKGLEIRSRYRTADPESLSMAQNVEFPVAGGPQKRRGHTGQDITLLEGGEDSPALDVEGLSYEPFATKTLPAGWLPGYGQISLNDAYSHGGADEYRSKKETTRLGLGLTKVPSTGLPAVWTGAEFVTGEDGEFSRSINTTMPVARVSRTAAYGRPNTRGCTVDGVELVAVPGPLQGGSSDTPKYFDLKLTLYTPYGKRVDVGGFEAVGDFFVLPVDGGFVILYYGSSWPMVTGYNQGTLYARTISLSGVLGSAQLIAATVSRVRMGACATPGSPHTDVVCAFWTGVPYPYVTFGVGPAAQQLSVRGLTVNVAAGTVVLASNGVGNCDINTITASWVGLGHAIACDYHQLFGVGVAFTYDGCMEYGGPDDRPLYCGFVRVSNDYTSVDSHINGTDKGLHVGAPEYSLAYPPPLYDHGWRCFDLSNDGKRHTFPADFSKVAVSFRSLPDADDYYKVDVWCSTIATLTESEGGVLVTYDDGVTTADYQVSPKPVTYHCSFYQGDNDPLEVVGVTGYEVASTAARVGMCGEVLLHHHGLTGGPFVSPSGSLFGGVSADPTLVLVDHKLQPLAKYAQGISWTGYTQRQKLDDYKVKTVVTRIAALGSTLDLLATTMPIPPDHDGEVVSITEDYVHPLRTATIGNTVAIAAGQVWAYDGLDLSEYGFHCAPAVTLMQDPVLTTGATGTAYVTAVLRRVNDRGEEIRSKALAKPFDASKVTLATNVFIPAMWRTASTVVDIAVMPPANPNYYVAMTFNLNDPALNLYTDGRLEISTANMSSNFAKTILGTYTGRMLPDGNASYLQPNSPPACEVIAAGQTRLWFGGGEVQPGGVTASNLYQVGFLPGWNDFHTQTVGKTTDTVTDLGFFQDNAYVFKRSGVFLISSDGPDDLGANGSWGAPRVLAQDGTPFTGTVANTEQGLVYLGASGLKLIGYGGGVQPLGNADPTFYQTGQVGKLLTTIASVVYYPEKDQLRYYKRGTDVHGSAVVLETREARFSTWTGVDCTGAVYSPQNRCVYLLKPNGRLWKEDANTGEVYADDGSNYEMVLRTAWLNPAGLGGYAQVRRVGWWGEWFGDHDLRLRVYINEKRSFEQEDTIDWAAQTNELSATTTWGSDFWGFGTYGGADADNLWRWTKRMNRQKCSAIMFELSDQGAATASFAPVVFAMEVGIKPNLDRIRVTDATSGSGGF